MHNKHIFIVKANNAELAISRVKGEIEGAEHLTSNNWWHTVGAVDLVQNSFTPDDTDRDYDKLHTVEGITEVINEYAGKDKYARLVQEVKKYTELENWFDVERCAKELDGIRNVAKNGFVLTPEKIMEVNADDWFEFGISDWTEVLYNEEDDDRVFAVIVDFHS